MRVSLVPVRGLFAAHRVIAALALLALVSLVLRVESQAFAAGPTLTLLESVEDEDEDEDEDAPSSCAAPVSAAPEPLLIPSEVDPDHMRLRWRQASVAWPVAPTLPRDDHAHLAAALGQREDMLAGREHAPSVRGPVEIDSDRAVAVWIAALEVVRVRQLGDPVPLRFVRGVDGHTAVIEDGIEVSDGPMGERRFELLQPPSFGAVWSIEADAPTTVMIERVTPRDSLYAAVEVEVELLDWIHDDAPGAEMPDLLVPNDDLARRLRLQAAIADELVRLGGDEPSLSKGVRAWRMLAAINELDRDRPSARPYFARDRKRPMELDGAETTRLDTEDSRTYRGLDRPQRWTIAAKGPGQLRIAARAWAAGQEPLAPAELRIYAGGRFIRRLALSDRQAKHNVDPGSALPKLEPLVTEAGEAVGEFAETVLVLAPGRVDYEFELVGGPALVAIEGARRIEATALALQGRTPRKRAKAAARAVAKTRSSAGPWLELLLARETFSPLSLTIDDPRIAALADDSPTLALELLALLASDTRVDDRALERLVAEARPLFAALACDPEVEPVVRGQLRTRWLELIAVKGDPDLVNSVVEQIPGGAEPIVELPVEGLRLLAELFEPRQEVLRSPVLAVLELARARAPADEGLREQYLRVWSALSRWSRRRPVSETASELGLPFRPVGEWLIPRQTLPREAAALANTWLRLDPGVPTQVFAKLGPGVVRRSVEGRDRTVSELSRMRLVDIHVASPLSDPAPVQISVDDHTWWSPQLRGVMRHRIAVSGGIHELTLDGPEGTVAWASVRPAENVEATPEQLGRREQMWSLADADWFLPGPAIPGIVRLELRWPLDQPATPVEIVVHQHGDYDGQEPPPAKTLVFDPRVAQVAAMSAVDAAAAANPVEVDLSATPMAGSPWASVRHDINLPIQAGTRHLSFEVEGGLIVPASLSLRRGLRPIDLYAGMSEARVPDPDAAPDPRIAATFDDLPALSGPEMLAEIEGLSRLLLYDPDDFVSRARRAALLLMLGETGHARADLVRLSAWSEDQDSAREQREFAAGLLAELERRFDRLIEPREIVVSDPAFDGAPTLVEPAVAAFVGPDRAALDPWLELWTSLRSLAEDEAVHRLKEALDAYRREQAEQSETHVEAEHDSGAALPFDSESERTHFIGELSRAELLSQIPTRTREAGRAWLELYGRLAGAPGHWREPLAVGLAAVGPLLAHLDNPDHDARDAGAAYGLARELEPGYGHTSVRRLAFIAALRSEWDTLDHSENNAGFERLELPVSELERSPSSRIREALMVAPWSQAEAEELRPGRKGVLAWDAEPGAVRAEFWCRAARPDLGPKTSAQAHDPDALGHARLRLRVREGDEVVATRDVEAGDGELVAVELPIATRARHRLEVVLGAEPIWLCSWRTRTLDVETAASEPAADELAARGEALDTRRRARWWTASRDREVEFVILGPTSLDIEARGVSDSRLEGESSTLDVSVEPLDRAAASGAVEAATLALVDAPDKSVITEARRWFKVDQSTVHTVVLSAPVAYRVKIRSDSGRVVMRARVRRDRDERPPPAQVSLRELDPRTRGYRDDFAWRSRTSQQLVVARDPIKPVASRIGTIDAELVLERDRFGEVDSFQSRLGGLLRVGWRRELIEDALYVRIAAHGRVRVKSPPAAGGIVGIGGRIRRIGLRLGTTLDVLAGPFAGRSAASLRWYAWVDRPVWIGRSVQLRPGVTAGFRGQSLTRADLGGTTLEPHPRVFLAYIEDHPWYLRPELGLRVYPLQDAVVGTMISAVFNSPGKDPAPVDHVNWDLEFQGIGREPKPWVPIWSVSYQLSARINDAHREDFELRQRFAAGLGVGVWVRDQTRLTLGLDAQLYVSAVSPRPPSTAFALWLRADAVFRRRLRDFGPGEIWFSEPWAPLRWADDPRQAPSTGL